MSEPNGKCRLEVLADAETVLSDPYATEVEVDQALQEIEKINQELEDIADARREERFSKSL